MVALPIVIRELAMVAINHIFVVAKIESPPKGLIAFTLAHEFLEEPIELIG